MRDYFRTVFNVWKMLMFFILLTAAFYIGMNGFDRYESYVHRYENPGDGAVSVSRPQTASEAVSTGSDGPFYRLWYFLNEGE